MKLPDLPLDVFRTILEETVITVGSSRAPRLRLVNRLFNVEVIRAVCRTDLLPTKPYPEGMWVVYYLQSKVLERSAQDSNYLIKTVRLVVDELAREYQGDEQDQKRIEISFALSQLVDDYLPCILNHIRRGSEWMRVAEPPNRQDTDYVWSKRRYEFALSYASGDGQSSHAPEHLLSAAAYVGSASLVGTLLERGINVNTGSNIFGKPLSTAARAGHLNIVRLLLAKGADPSDGVYPRTEEDERLLLSRNHKEELEDEIARVGSVAYTALGAAAMGGHEQVVRLLLQPEFGVSKATYSYRAAIMNASCGGNAKLLKFLMEAGDFSSVSERCLSGLREDALFHATEEGHIDVVCLMLDRGVPVNVQKIYMGNVSTPLGQAAVFGHLEIAQLLLRRGAAVDACHHTVRTPIMEAAARGYLQIVELLLDHGAIVHQGRLPHPVESAAYNGQAATVQFLLERNAHLGMRCDGSLAFEGAVEAGYESVVAILRSYGFHAEEHDSDT